MHLISLMHLRMQVFIACSYPSVRAPNSSAFAPSKRDSSVFGPFEQAPASTSAWALNIPRHKHGPRCKHCGSTVYRYAAFKYAPAFLAFSLDGMNDCTVDSSLVLNIEADSVSYRLRGAVYFDSAALHFMARTIDEADRVLIHDGMTNGGVSTLENDHSIGVDMVSLGDGTGCLSALLYTKC
ncbi:hypothetical protein D9757_001273 [Collybiopsis confluens]|uniref:Uncharacterized protein n=1 Tax=Collybiopsis confluens TaxID=2823264 RepID=A0A8H5I0Q9_9AGAR|nr:hypothetical protein D9757_003255 [Collybiopsis confluens]KAF5392950.1 hypothetical protein D9757_001273 [Collybiopsis confluens]